MRNAVPDVHGHQLHDVQSWPLRRHPELTVRDLSLPVRELHERDDLHGLYWHEPELNIVELRLLARLLRQRRRELRDLSLHVRKLHEHHNLPDLHGHEPELHILKLRLRERFLR